MRTSFIYLGSATTFMHFFPRITTLEQRYCPVKRKTEKNQLEQGLSAFS
jgi:hypothetical protein